MKNAKNYTIFQDSNAKNASKRFYVYEKATDHIISLNLSFREAKNMANNLENGYGFDGWTPYFFVNYDFKVPEIENDFNHS